MLVKPRRHPRVETVGEMVGSLPDDTTGHEHQDARCRLSILTRDGCRKVAKEPTDVLRVKRHLPY